MAYLRIVETSLDTLIRRRAVDRHTVDLLQRSLPLLLDDLPDGCRLTAADVLVGGGSLRIVPVVGESGGNVVAQWGMLMLQALDASAVESRRLRRIARQCVAGRIPDTASLRLALERCEAGNVHTWVVIAIAALLSLLVWINNL